MSDAKALLAAAWSTGDLTPLLALADMWDEQDDPDFAEFLRLTIAQGQTARCDRTHPSRLRQLREEMVRRVRGTAWPDMAIDPGASIDFSRRPRDTLPDREFVLVQADRQTINRFRFEVEGEDELIRTQDGDELLRRRCEADTLAFLHNHPDLYASVLILAKDFFPISGQPTDRKATEAEQLRLFEGALAPTQIAIGDLPEELVPFVAWLLADHIAHRTRWGNDGEIIPGTHLFIFRDGAWQYEESLHHRDLTRAGKLLKQRLRRETRQGVLVGLLIRLDDYDRLTARKLMWIGADGRTRQTANLKGVASTLPGAVFQQVADELGLQEPAFVLDTPEKIRALFGKGRGRRPRR